jgi:hypothetical protein
MAAQNKYPTVALAHLSSSAWRLLVVVALKDGAACALELQELLLVFLDLLFNVLLVVLNVNKLAPHLTHYLNVCPGATFRTSILLVKLIA